jgi:hypothetical protein
LRERRSGTATPPLGAPAASAAAGATQSASASLTIDAGIGAAPKKHCGEASEPAAPAKPEPRRRMSAPPSGAPRAGSTESMRGGG